MGLAYPKEETTSSA